MLEESENMSWSWKKFLRNCFELGTLPGLPFAIAHVHCPECDEIVGRKDKYCSHCGEKLLWNWKN
jgi:hypothetical protein